MLLYIVNTTLKLDLKKMVNEIEIAIPARKITIRSFSEIVKPYVTLCGIQSEVETFESAGFSLKRWLHPLKSKVPVWLTCGLIADSLQGSAGNRLFVEASTRVSYLHSHCLLSLTVWEMFRSVLRLLKACVKGRSRISGGAEREALCGRGSVWAFITSLSASLLALFPFVWAFTLMCHTRVFSTRSPLRPLTHSSSFSSSLYFLFTSLFPSSLSLPHESCASCLVTLTEY